MAESLCMGAESLTATFPISRPAIRLRPIIQSLLVAKVCAAIAGTVIALAFGAALVLIPCVHESLNSKLLVVIALIAMSLSDGSSAALVVLLWKAAEWGFRGTTLSSCILTTFVVRFFSPITFSILPIIILPIELSSWPAYAGGALALQTITAAQAFAHGESLRGTTVRYGAITTFVVAFATYLNGI